MQTPPEADARIKELVAQIEIEKDPVKLTSLVEELGRRAKPSAGRKGADRQAIPILIAPHGLRAGSRNGSDGLALPTGCRRVDRYRLQDLDWQLLTD